MKCVSTLSLSPSQEYQSKKYCPIEVNEKFKNPKVPVDLKQAVISPQVN